MSAEAGRDPAVIAALIERLFVLMRTAAAHGEDHPMTRQAAEAAAAAWAAASPPLALQFVAEGLFCDRVMVPLEVEGFEQVVALEEALSNLGVHELSASGPPSADGLLDLGRALARGRMGASDELDLLRIDGLAWREIPNARRGVDVESVDPQVFAATQAAQAIAGAERIHAAGPAPWPWGAGVAVVRRLVRALEVDPAALQRAIEVAPGAWTPARRAVGAALDVLVMLHSSRVGQAVLRAAAHAALGAGLAGLRQRDGFSLPAAARVLLGRMLEAPVTARSGVEPHRLKVTALVHLLAEGGEEADAGASGATGDLEIRRPIEVAYALARRRCPRGVGFDLSKADLLAWALTRWQPAGLGLWIQLLIAAAGVVPPGVSVRLADGRLGSVLGPGPGGDPWRPLVLVAGRAVEPAAAVRLVAAR